MHCFVHVGSKMVLWHSHNISQKLNWSNFYRSVNFIILQQSKDLLRNVVKLCNNNLCTSIHTKIWNHATYISENSSCILLLKSIWNVLKELFNIRLKSILIHACYWSNYNISLFVNVSSPLEALTDLLAD